MADGLFDETDLCNAIGRPLFVAIYDDDNDGQPDSGPVAACIESATAEVLAWFAGTYEDWSEVLPDPVPPALKYAAIDFGIAYTARRRPDIFRASNSKSWEEFEKAAIARVERYQQAKQRLPASTGTPKNVGSYVTNVGNNIITSNSDGTDNQGDF